jgi:hypothetical protein
MTARNAFDEAKRAMSFSFERKTSLCDPFLSVMPVSGVAISFLGSTAQTTICASDDTAAHLDELQFDLGEGPCWEAMVSRRPVIHGDIQSEDHAAWPEFLEAIRDGPIAAMFAFPLTVGSLEIGAVDLYNTSPSGLTPGQIADASALAHLASWQVLRRVLADKGDLDGAGFPYSRREVHQATGMIIAQLDIGAADAVLLLRAHAFSSGRSMREIAHEIVERTLSFAEPSAGEPGDSGL